MKPIISSSTNQFTPLMYIFKNATNIEMISSSKDIKTKEIDSSIPKTYQKLYYKYKSDLENKATVLINNYNKYGSEEYFNLITEQLKKEGYKFTTINMVTNDKITFKNIITTISKLNPNISIIQLVLVLIKFLILVILFFIKRVNVVASQEYTFKEIFTNLMKTKKVHRQKLIINPNQVNIDELIKDKSNYNEVKHINLKELKFYQDITYIYEKYNPKYYTEYLKIKNYTKQNNININIVKI